jgi:hypothetical protein
MMTLYFSTYIANVLWQGLPGHGRVALRRSRLFYLGIHCAYKDYVLNLQDLLCLCKNLGCCREEPTCDVSYSNIYTADH